jgi:hypothetical protein
MANVTLEETVERQPFCRRVGRYVASDGVEMAHVGFVRLHPAEATSPSPISQSPR